jgi:hypothetical protein
VNDFTFLSLPAETWRFLNTFAPWFSALGTFAAVAITLWLTISRSRPRVKVLAGHRVLTGGGSLGPDMLLIRIVNTGDRMARITSAGWRKGALRSIMLSRTYRLAPRVLS